MLFILKYSDLPLFSPLTILKRSASAVGVLPLKLSPQLIAKPLCMCRRGVGLHREIKVRHRVFQLAHRVVDWPRTS